MRHSTGFYIELFIVFDDTDRLLRIERGRIGFNCFEKQPETETVEKGSRLADVRTIAQVEHEGFQAAYIHSALLHDMVCG